MSRVAVLVFGSISYLLFLASFLWLVGFLMDFAVPRSIDAGPAVGTTADVVSDVLLLLAFALQHTAMARPGFKAVWTRIVPRPIERSAYVLATVGVLVAFFFAWRPLPAVVWETSGVTAGLLTALCALGVVIVLLATFAIDHFELFGLRQVVDFFRGREHRPPTFRVSMMHRVVRHPLYVGWLLAFWAAPRMTVGHVLFAGMMTAYILVAIVFEERDLVVAHGRDYVEYRKRVPMLVPLSKRAT